MKKMTEYRIHPLSVGSIAGPKMLVTHLVDPNIMADCESYVWYLEGGDKKIIIDTGMMAPDKAGGYHGYPMTDCGPDAVVKALGTVGLKCEDIDYVILSHLHFDHVANNHLFPDATFVVMKAELENAKSHLPYEDGLYIENSAEFARQLEQCKKLLLVEDGYQLTDGITLMRCPGHSEGLIATLVNTSDGPYVCASDMFYSRNNVYPELDKMASYGGTEIAVTPLPNYAFYPMGSHVDLKVWYDSCFRVLAAAGGDKNHILTGHDASYSGRIFPEK